MKIDWKKKLTSRKFWAAVCGFVSMVVMALGKDASTAQTVTGMVMAAGSLIAYMIGEGLADSGTTYPVLQMPDVPTEQDPFEGCCCDDCKITFEEGENDGISDA